MLQVKHLLHVLQTLKTSTLFRRGGGGGGGDLVKAVFMSVYCGLAANSIKTREKGEMYQNLLARIVARLEKPY